MAIISATAEISAVRFNEQISAPSTPTAGYAKMYTTVSGLFLLTSDGNSVGPFTASGGGGGTNYADDSKVHGYLATDQTGVVSGVDTIVTLDSELFDSGSEFNTTTGVFTADETGYYHIDFCIRFNQIQGIECRVLGKLTKNDGGGYADAVLYEAVGKVSKFPSCGGSRIIQLDSGDLLRLNVSHDSGSDETLLAGESRTYLSIYRVA